MRIAWDADGASVGVTAQRVQLELRDWQALALLPLPGSFLLTSSVHDDCNQRPFFQELASCAVILVG